MKARRRVYRPRITPEDPQPGIEAKIPGQCVVCDGPIIRGERIYFRRGHAAHCRCAPGADDE